MKFPPLYRLGIGALLSLTLVACHQSEALPDDATEEMVKIQAQAYVPGNGTRVLTKDLQFYWGEGDYISVWSTHGGQMYAKVTESSNAEGVATAQFSGNGFSLSRGETYYTFYPCLNQCEPNAIPLVYTQQVQQQNDDVAHLAAVDFMATTALCSLASGETKFLYQHLQAIIKFVLTFQKAETVKSITLSTADASAVFAMSGTYDMTTQTFTSTQANPQVTLKLAANGVGTTQNQVIGYLAVPAVDLSQKTLKLAVEVAGSSYDEVSFQGVNLEAGKYYSASFTQSFEIPGNFATEGFEREDGAW